MKKINGLLLAGICAGSLYGCGGSDDKGADPANSYRRANHSRWNM
ncbi:hypothetical protein [Aeromonas hydrophila]|nr:hypothetical protein [Aeromonas hydrophila]